MDKSLQEEGIRLLGGTVFVQRELKMVRAAKIPIRVF